MSGGWIETEEQVNIMNKKCKRNSSMHVLLCAVWRNMLRELSQVVEVLLLFVLYCLGWCVAMETDINRNRGVCVRVWIWESGCCVIFVLMAERKKPSYLSRSQEVMRTAVAGSAVVSPSRLRTIHLRGKPHQRQQTRRWTSCPVCSKYE